MALEKRSPATWETAAPALVLAGAFITYLWLFEPLLDGHQGGLAGDYGEFLPRLLGEYYWFKSNSWFAIPWFTPAFCGGMPEWANPQSMPYSLPQLLVFLFDPVTSVQLTFAAFAFAGMSGTWLLTRHSFQASRASSTLAAVLFLFNGFFMARTVAGHLAMHPFMLTPLNAWLITRPARTRSSRLLSVLAGGLLVALMLQGGMLVILPPVILSWIAMGLIQQLRTGSSREVWLRLTAVLVIGVLLSASKLAALSALVAQFPRDQYALPGFRSLEVLVQAFFNTIFWRGVPEPRPDFVGFKFLIEIHERQFGLSPIPLLIFVASVFLSERWTVDLTRRGNRLASLALVLLFVIPLAVNLHAEGWTEFLKSLPVIRSSSSLTRWFVLYVVVIPPLTALAVDHLSKPTLLAGLGIAGVLLWNGTADLSLFKRPYDPRRIVGAWTAVNEGKPVPTINHVDVPGEGHESLVHTGDDDLTEGGCQVACIEPLFGYRLEKLPWRPLHSGPALDTSSGVLNIKDPRCEIFPAENHCKPGDQFPLSSTDDAGKFLDWKPFPFERSTRQSLADGINLLALLLFAGGVVAGVHFLRQERTSVPATAGRKPAKSHGAGRKAS